MNLNKDFLSYLTNIYNYSKIVTKINSESLILKNQIDNEQMTVDDINTQINSLPLYSDFFKLISKKHSSHINQYTVQNIFHDNESLILDSITNDILNMKLKLDKIPTTEKKIKQHLALQNIYIGPIDNIYNFNNFNLYYNNIKEQNIFYMLLAKQYDINTNLIFFDLFTMSLIISKLGLKHTNFLQLIYQQCNSFDIKTKISNEFSVFLNNDLDFDKKLTNVILTSVFQIHLTNTDVIEKVKNVIRNEFDFFVNSFDEYLSKEMIYEIYSKITAYIFHFLSIDLLKDFNPLHSLVYHKQGGDIMFQIEQQIQSILNNTTIYSLRPYMFMLYYYKNTPEKFINIISIIINNFVNTTITTPIIDKIYKINISDELLTEFNVFLSNKYNDTGIKSIEKIKETINTPENMIVEAPMIIYFSTLIEKWFLDNRIVLISKLLKNVYNLLISEGIIDKSFDYYNQIDIVFIYIKSFLISSISSSHLFSLVINNLKDIINNIDNNDFYSKPFNDESIKSLLTNDIVLKNITTFFNNFAIGATTKEIYYKILQQYLIL